MTSEFLLKAIGQMDDELVLEAAQTPARRPIPWQQLGGLAAALLLCAGIASIPGLLPRYSAASGAATPEADADLVGTTTENMMADYESRSDPDSVAQGPSAADKSESQPASGTTQAFLEARFFTQRGVYLPTVVDPEDLKQKVPPENARALGNLIAAVPGQSVYPATGTQALVGCPVWESGDGKYLYVQLPDGGWITARLAE